VQLSVIIKIKENRIFVTHTHTHIYIYIYIYIYILYTLFIWIFRCLKNETKIKKKLAGTNWHVPQTGAIKLYFT